MLLLAASCALDLAAGLASPLAACLLQDRRRESTAGLVLAAACARDSLRVFLALVAELRLESMLRAWVVPAFATTSARRVPVVRAVVLAFCAD